MIYSERLSPLCHWENRTAIRKRFGASHLNVTGKITERNESLTSQRCGPIPHPSLPFPSGRSKNRWEGWPWRGRGGGCWSHCPRGQCSITAGPEHPPGTSFPAAGDTSLGRAAGRGMGRDMGAQTRARGDTVVVGIGLVLRLPVAVPQTHPGSPAGLSVRPLHGSHPSGLTRRSPPASSPWICFATVIYFSLFQPFQTLPFLPEILTRLLTHILDSFPSPFYISPLPALPSFISYPCSHCV